MGFVIFPMVYLSHRALSRFVSQASGADKDITHAAEEYFGRNTALFISVLYFFAIFPICLAYCVGISNTFESFIYHQFLPLASADVAEFIQSIYQVSTSENGKVVANLFPFYRALLVFILVSLFMIVMLLSEELITRICEWLVYPLCAILFLFSLYLIPHFKEFITIVWLTLPVLVFSFNHSPAISTFTLSVKRHYKEHKSGEKADQILFKTSIMLLIFVMFFVFSCVLSLNAEEFSDARAQNIPVLSYFANKLDNPFIAYGGPLVAFLAITSSFLGIILEQEKALMVSFANVAKWQERQIPIKSSSGSSAAFRCIS